MIEINKIYNEDCLIGMKRIEDKSIDMILCDLPYGTTKNKWDAVIPFDELWNNYKRIIKENGAIVLFGSQPFTTDLINSNRKDFRYEIIWDKKMVTGFATCRVQPMKCHENIIVFYSKKPTYNPQLRDVKNHLEKYLMGLNLKIMVI
jgi:site-specific DNA-methyltransferase (adenine-specific)